jgi:hypothetical protein
MAKILVPENNQKNIDLIHIFTDSNLITTQYMLENTPFEISQTNAIIYLERDETYEISKQKINELFSEINLTIKSESLIGISKSSLKVFACYNSSNVGFVNPSNFKFIGLIDPELKNNNLTLNLGANVNVVYNIKNWINKPLNQKLLIKLVNKLTLSSQKEEKNLNIQELISYFFTKYKSNLT